MRTTGSGCSSFSPKEFGVCYYQRLPLFGTSRQTEGLEMFLSIALLHQQPLGFKTHCCAMGNRHPMELFKKHIRKTKAMDATGKKQPGTVAASSPPFPNQNASKTPAAVDNVPSRSCHVCACHGPMVPSHTCQGFMLLTPALTLIMKCVSAQYMSQRAASPGSTRRDLDRYQCPDTFVTKSN